MNSVLAMTQSANSLVFSNPKTGNVLALLNTLYTSGFASHSPSHPLLSGRTMHTLYAVSFIIYSLTDICDWMFVYFTLRGYVTSFPLKTWIVVALVATTVAGTMLTSLLIVLCVENAFAHRLDVTPYRSGFAVIVESFIQWIQAFNNFRIAFLYMILHDVPLTMLNFFFIASCRCSGPQVLHWPVIMATSTTVVSVSWRMVMLYFAYRRMICSMRKSSNAISVANYPTAMEHLRANLSQSGGGRLDEYDECWPIRFSVRKMYGTNAESEADQLTRHTRASIILRSRSFIISVIDAFIYKIVKLTSFFFRTIGCILLTTIIYTISILTLCAPCCYHYGCKTNSFYHRHRCARSFVRYFSQSFHYLMFILSLVTVIVLFLLNMTLLTSVHAAGSSQIPFEISHVCIEINLKKREITARVDSSNREHESSVTTKFICKPFWEDGGFGLGLNRQEAGPWQTRIKLSTRKLLAISTQISMNYTDRQNPHHTLLYDYAILQRYTGTRKRFDCVKGSSSEWVFKESVDRLVWPYYVACDRAWSMRAEHLIECEIGDASDDIVFF